MLTRIAEKLGILDKIAPRKKNNATENDSSSNVKAGNNKRKLTAQESRDEYLARKLQAEEDRRFNMLKSQKNAEDRAENAGLFAKRQRVIYLHRGTNTQYDAIVVGVHFDDGPDDPYYVSSSLISGLKGGY